MVRKVCWKKSSKHNRIIGSRCNNEVSSLRHGGETVVGNLGSLASIFLRSCTWFWPLYGGLAVSSSYMIAPTDHRSAFASYLWKRNISGAMYSGEPHNVSARSCSGMCLAKPKSPIFKVP